MNKRETRLYIIVIALCITAAARHSQSADSTDSRNCAKSAQNRKSGFAEYSNDSLFSVFSLPTEDASVEQWLKENGWKVQRGNIELYRIENGALLMKNIDATTVIGKEFNRTIDPNGLPLIEFKVRIDEIPIGTDVTTRNMDDAAFRLFILFDRGGGLLSPPETIGYVWDSTMESGDKGRSGKFDQIRYIAIGSGTQGLGEWNCYERNIMDDYQMLFGSNEIPHITAIALKCDSNHSGTVAASAIRWIRLKPARTEPDPTGTLP